jgi:acyl carrier protein
VAARQYELRTVLDNGDMARAGDVGTLRVRGRRGVELFQEYYGDEEATAAAFDADGWFDTGDRVRSDENGWIYFTGRSKDLIKVGGENVIPAEIEQVLAQHGSVRECAVVGASDPAFGEVPVAFVVPVADECAGVVESIITEINPRLAPVKRVRRVVLVRDLPRSTISKVAKNLLRQWLEEPDLVPLDRIDDDPRACGDITAIDKAEILEDLREIWAASFNVALGRIGADMDFFELGGDSLMGLEVLTRIGAHFGVKLEPEVLYEYSTPGALAGYLEVLMLTRALKRSDSGGDSPFVEL